jgi:hypothetical protein
MPLTAFSALCRLVRGTPLLVFTPYPAIIHRVFGSFQLDNLNDCLKSGSAYVRLALAQTPGLVDGRLSGFQIQLHLPS